MHPLSARILELEAGILRLTEANRKLRKQLEELMEERDILRQQNPSGDGEEKETEESILTPNPKTFIQYDEDQIKTKQIINEMMREIDKCLLLLEK